MIKFNIIMKIKYVKLLNYFKNIFLNLIVQLTNYQNR